MSIPRILIIAGSDSGGGAGIQADIKTVTMLGGHAMTAVTAITAQNTLGVDAVHAVPADMVLAQIDAVVRDIGVDAVKIGMIGSARTALAVADRLAELRGIPIVFDPVMIATSGAALADDATIGAFERLIQVASIITPNLPELKALGGDAAALAERHGTAMLVKGGHGDDAIVTDRLYQSAASGPPEIAFEAPRIDSVATHGTGCTLSSALATELAKEWDLPRAVERARLFVRLAMLDAPGLGGGNGPMGHARVRLDLPATPYAPSFNQVTVPAEDIAASEHFYRLLGLTQIVSTPGKYARFETGDGATFSLERPEKMGACAVVYFECADLDLTVSYLKAQGIAVKQEPVDERWGWREARLADPSGNPVCLYQAGEMRRFPLATGGNAGMIGPMIAGVDEAGRGPLAGPVVAAAVILCPGGIPGLDDSKKLTERRRETLFPLILDRCTVGIGVATVEEIDRLNILWATMLAMTRAVEGLGRDPAEILVDGNRCPDWRWRSRWIIGGDATEPCISAASIVAKVTRDRMMRAADAAHPGYGWASNKGYGSAAHLAALRTLGPTPSTAAASPRSLNAK